MSRYLIAVERVAHVIGKGVILRAYNQLDHETVSVGPYQEAVDRGYRFAVIGKKAQSEHFFPAHAAQRFVDLCGTTRANEVTRKYI
mgnify:CR=1 FL=1